MPEQSPASRGYHKLVAALDAFAVDPSGLTCADLGCSTGGFTDALIRAGAARVFSVDTAYGELAWHLRQDPRITVLERTNALHAPPPADAAGACDLVTIDLGWTRQERALPAALPWLKANGQVITLVKPHYETGRHALTDAQADDIAHQVLQTVATSGWNVVQQMPSPLAGGKGKNREWLALLKPADPSQSPRSQRFDA